MGPTFPRRFKLDPDDESDTIFGRASILDHLEELRKRLVRACLAIAVGMLVSFFFIERIVNFVLAPTRAALPPGSSLIYTQPTEAFSLYIEIAMMAGAILTSPIVVYQLWRFIAPGLRGSDKNLALPFVLLMTTGAVSGAAFGHYIVFPYMISFFGTFSSTDLTFLPKLSDVFGLYTKMILGMAIVFQIPTLAYFLARLGLVTARMLWGNFKYAILVIFILAAILTPSADPWNQTVFAAPMIALYLLSIGIAWLCAPSRKAASPGDLD
jgi:sec-independent protein translocase protein TatC